MEPREYIEPYHKHLQLSRSYERDGAYLSAAINLIKAQHYKNMALGRNDLTDIKDSVDAAFSKLEKES